MLIDGFKVNGVLKVCLQCVDKNNNGHLVSFVHKVHKLIYKIQNVVLYGFLRYRLVS